MLTPPTYLLCKVMRWPVFGFQLIAVQVKFTFSASLTYALHYLMTPIKWILNSEYWKSITISVISESLSPIYRMVSEKFSFKTQNFTNNVWLINFFATHQFRSFRWQIFPSILLACNKLNIGQDAWANQLFQLLNLVRIYGHGFFELTRTLMRKM